MPTIYFFFPETARHSLEEIDEIFESSNTVFDSVRVAKKLRNRKHSESDEAEKGANVNVSESSPSEQVDENGTVRS